MKQELLLIGIVLIIAMIYFYSQKNTLQTDLTAEQITQMEKDLENQRKLLYQGANEIDKLEKQLIKVEEEKDNKIAQAIKLQEKIDKKELNEDEKKLENYFLQGEFNIPTIGGLLFPNNEDLEKEAEKLSFKLEEFDVEKNWQVEEYTKMMKGLVKKTLPKLRQPWIGVVNNLVDFYLWGFFSILKDENN